MPAGRLVLVLALLTALGVLRSADALGVVLDPGRPTELHRGPSAPGGKSAWIIRAAAGDGERPKRRPPTVYTADGHHGPQLPLVSFGAGTHQPVSAGSYRPPGQRPSRPAGSSPATTTWLNTADRYTSVDNQRIPSYDLGCAGRQCTYIISAPEGERPPPAAPFNRERVHSYLSNYETILEQARNVTSKYVVQKLEPDTRFPTPMEAYQRDRQQSLEEPPATAHHGRPTGASSAWPAPAAPPRPPYPTRHQGYVTMRPTYVRTSLSLSASGGAERRPVDSAFAASSSVGRPAPEPPRHRPPIHPFDETAPSYERQKPERGGMETIYASTGREPGRRPDPDPGRPQDPDPGPGAGRDPNRNRYPYYDRDSGAVRDPYLNRNRSPDSDSITKRHQNSDRDPHERHGSYSEQDSYKDRDSYKERDPYATRDPYRERDSSRNRNPHDKRRPYSEDPNTARDPYANFDHYEARNSFTDGNSVRGRDPYQKRDPYPERNPYPERDPYPDRDPYPQRDRYPGRDPTRHDRPSDRFEVRRGVAQRWDSARPDSEGFHSSTRLSKATNPPVIMYRSMRRPPSAPAAAERRARQLSSATDTPGKMLARRVGGQAPTTERRHSLETGDHRLFSGKIFQAHLKSGPITVLGDEELEEPSQDLQEQTDVDGRQAVSRGRDGTALITTDEGHRKVPNVMMPPLEGQQTSPGHQQAGTQQVSSFQPDWGFKHPQYRVSSQRAAGSKPPRPHVAAPPSEQRPAGSVFHHLTAPMQLNEGVEVASTPSPPPQIRPSPSAEQALKRLLASLLPGLVHV
ncbi:serine/arginine repetitive matrix protein 5-like [Amphibalanus amphitrite]|uniref:serine/arginine repetitive matrix protein 5-like n=1 Tax=Amphibalanus amphitrite TaxID=1232801 RepID=UPI001C91B91D|nr:serine/arginine repetitive matrix protein 5-like [Amphibalanus amphitrite]